MKVLVFAELKNSAVEIGIFSLTPFAWNINEDRPRPAQMPRPDWYLPVRPPLLRSLKAITIISIGVKFDSLQQTEKFSPWNVLERSQSARQPKPPGRPRLLDNRTTLTEHSFMPRTN